MSQTTLAIDSYLANQVMPPNDLTVDPKYFNVRMVTPIGRFAYVHVDRPHAIRNLDGTQGEPKYSATLLFAPGTNERPIIADLHRAAAAVADTKWPAIQRPDPQNPSNIITVTGSYLFSVPQEMGGVHYPLRQGNDNYMRNPQTFALWRGLWFINTSMQPASKAGVEQKPVCLDERGTPCDPRLFYSGCYGRAMITVAAFDNRGKKGVTFYLNAVQFARHGERMASFDQQAAAAGAFAKAGALSGDIGTPPGLGPHSMQPGALPPGAVPIGTPPGFAAPAQPPQGGYAMPQQPAYAQPAQPAYAQQPAQQTPYGFPPPNQGVGQPGPAPGGARPPGV